MYILSLVLFTTGISILAFRIVSQIRFSRSRFSYQHLLQIQPLWRKMLDRWKAKEESSPNNQKMIEKLRLAGLSIHILTYNFLKLAAMCLILLIFIFRLPLYEQLIDVPVLMYGFALFICWFVPDLLVTFLVEHRKTKLFLEIAKLSQRIGICLHEKADLRETLLRAGRTMVLLKPYLNELSTQWNTGQEEAIHRFGKQVGIPEIYPLVNTLLATSKVDTAEIATILEQQVENIEKTLEFQVQKKIESAPLYIVFLVMIPFVVVFGLLLYPWTRYLMDMLNQSF